MRRGELRSPDEDGVVAMDTDITPVSPADSEHGEATQLDQFRIEAGSLLATQKKAEEQLASMKATLKERMQCADLNEAVERFKNFLIQYLDTTDGKRHTPEEDAVIDIMLDNLLDAITNHHTHDRSSERKGEYTNKTGIKKILTTWGRGRILPYASRGDITGPTRTFTDIDQATLLQLLDGVEHAGCFSVYDTFKKTSDCICNIRIKPDHY